MSYTKAPIRTPKWRCTIPYSANAARIYYNNSVTFSVCFIIISKRRKTTVINRIQSVFKKLTFSEPFPSKNIRYLSYLFIFHPVRAKFLYQFFKFAHV